MQKTFHPRNWPMILFVMALFPLTGLLTLSNIAYKATIPSFVEIGIAAKPFIAFSFNIVISLLVIAGLLAFRFYMNARNPLYRQIPLFGLYLNIHTRWLYPASIVFQEFFIKAFTQENIGILLQDGHQEEKNGSDRKQALLASFITAVFFFILHLQYELYYMTGAFLQCFVTGLLYEKDRTIWGPVLIHIAIGFLPRCFGILQILEGVW